MAGHYHRDWSSRWSVFSSSSFVFSACFVPPFAQNLDLTRVAGTSSGDHLSNQVDGIVKRTIMMIEQDAMSRKPAILDAVIRPDLAAIKRETPPRGQPAPHSNTATADGDPPAAQIFKPAAISATSPSYPPVAYQDQMAAAAITKDAAANGGSGYVRSRARIHLCGGGGADQRGQRGRPQRKPPRGLCLAGNPTHIQPGVRQQRLPSPGRTRGRTGRPHMADSQDRISASALLDLGAAHPQRDVATLGQPPAGSATDSGNQSCRSRPTDWQWPLLLFHGAVSEA